MRGTWQQKAGVCLHVKTDGVLAALPVSSHNSLVPRPQPHPHACRPAGRPACSPLPIQRLRPFRIQPPGTLRAVVVRAEASLPLLGSVKAQQPTCGEGLGGGVGGSVPACALQRHARLLAQCDWGDVSYMRFMKESTVCVKTHANTVHANTVPLQQHNTTLQVPSVTHPNPPTRPPTTPPHKPHLLEG